MALSRIPGWRWVHDILIIFCFRKRSKNRHDLRSQSVFCRAPKACSQWTHHSSIHFLCLGLCFQWGLSSLNSLSMPRFPISPAVSDPEVACRTRSNASKLRRSGAENLIGGRWASHREFSTFFNEFGRGVPDGYLFRFDWAPLLAWFLPAFVFLLFLIKSQQQADASSLKLAGIWTALNFRLSPPGKQVSRHELPAGKPPDEYGARST